MIIQFAKAPVAGSVKTRMQPHLNPEQACALHCELLQWTCASLCGSQLGDVELWISGAQESCTFVACGSMGISQMRAQQGRDLGERMHHAMRIGLDRYCKVLLVGSDCPDIDKQYLAGALSALDRTDLVLGPACDGGYVLIGAKRIDSGLFDGVEWGGAKVFQQTLERARKLGFGSEVLTALRDIDRPEDLPHWQSLKGA